MLQHRDSQKRIYQKGATYFITSNTYERFEYFKEPILAELFIKDLWYAVELKRFKLHGYTVLLDHVHLLITPKSVATYSEIMRSLKTNFSRDANDILLNRVERMQTAEESDVAPRRFLPHEEHIRRTVLNLQKRFLQKHGLHHDFPKFQWQKSFRDHVIRGRPDFKIHLDYIHKNALKHGLVTKADDYIWMWVEGMPEPVFD